MVYEELKKILLEQLKVSPSKITREANIIKDLNADSLDIVEMLMRLEEKFNINIPDDVAAGLKTIGDIIDYVEAQL